MSQTHELHGKGAVVIGGAGAIGRAISAGLVHIGMNVVLVDIVDEIEAVAQELGRGVSSKVVGFQADVAYENEVDLVFSETHRVLGNPYALIHAAGVYPRSSLVDLGTDEWDATQGVNLRSFFLCTRSAVRMMREGDEGRIVGLASGLAVAPRARSSAYVASKAGLMAFVGAVAAELVGANVTINCLSPGLTESPMMRSANTDNDVVASVERSGRLPTQPSEILSPLMYLLGSDARNVSGTTLWMRPPR